MIAKPLFYICILKV